MNIFTYDIYSKIPSHCDYITFGMGCFWGAERRFWTLKGLKTTIVGYAGGNKENPSYEESMYWDNWACGGYKSYF